MLKFNLIIGLIFCHMSFSLAIKVHCRHVERIHEDHIHLCCKHPDGHNDVSEMCAKKTNFKYLPSASEEALEDVTVDQVMLGACWAKCVFDHYGFLKKDDETLNMMAVHTHYKMYHKTDPEYETEMLAAFDKCHSQSEEAMTKFLSMTFVKALSDSNYCKPASSVILSCVIYHFFHSCPKNRWSNSTECTETLAFAKKCKDVLTTM